MMHASFTVNEIVARLPAVLLAAKSKELSFSHACTHIKDKEQNILGGKRSGGGGEEKWELNRETTEKRKTG